MATIESTAISRPRPPDLIPGYSLEKLVGKGGMGEVYKGIQLSLGRTVAVKLLAPELAHDKSFVTRFEKEAAALATLSHPHIVSIVDKGKHKDTYYLVMEFVDGASLREMMRGPLLDTTSALKIGMDICRAIEYAHGRGVIHRDLKPENILFDEQAGGIPKVSDFGLAAFSQTDQAPSKFNVTETHVSMGTLSYMAPEQRVDAKSADHRADIYSLGVILYELAVGEVPVGNYDPPSHKKNGVDKRLDGIVARCLKPDPADRYQSVSELILDMEPLVPVSFSQRPRKLSPVERAKLAVDRAVRRVMRIAAIALVAAAALVLGAAALRSGTERSAQVSNAEALTADLSSKGAVTTPGRIAEEKDLRTVTVGDGPDSITWVVAGRAISSEGRGIKFTPPGTKSSVGRASLDSEVDGVQLDLSAEASTQVATGGVMGLVKRVVLGAQSEPRSAVALYGSPGRYVALVVSGAGEPVALEIALGDQKHFTTLGPPSPKDGTAHLELSIDRKGELLAFATLGRDKRAVGQPVSLGPGWKKLFGKAPAPSLTCIEGGCEFRKISYEILREPTAPPSPPLASVDPPKPPEVKPASGTTKPPLTPPKKTNPKPPPPKKGGGKKSH
ncbi:MAG TPA: serine/threonine-protein kinase [Myxococcaceae bacterium]|nr:serine/threonine-protein kinase [Myxococcaceae bacterium]